MPYLAHQLMLNRLEAEVRSAYKSATEGTASPDELISTVREFVRELKREGLPPEKVIVAIKEVCGMPLITFAADTDAAADIAPAKQICDMMLRAAIDEYYATSRPGNSPAGSVSAAP